MKLYPIIFILVIAYGIVTAQDQEKNHLPVLNNHYFIPNSNTPAPFIKTHFGMNLGIASSRDFENVILEIDGEKLIALKGSLIFADLNFDYQQKIKDWIALHINMGITARIGTELQSMLTQGVNTVTSFRMGWLAKVLEDEKNMLSASIQINNHSANFINIGDFIEDLIRDTVATSITKNVPILNGSVGLRYAHGFNELLGIQGFASLGYGESYERGKSDFIYRLGGLFDINLATKTKVPLGFALFYNLNAVPDIVQVKSKSASLGGFKISYSGAPHFNLGLEISRLLVPIPKVDEKVNSTSVFIASRYYFN
ncbi:MAG: hypothetical protein MI975_14410 [Cytophagales bacterium]|nr:hypothetical protein [Cytophagales bacterium]